MHAGLGWLQEILQGRREAFQDIHDLVEKKPEEVAEKIIRHSEALGGISRFSFQLDNAGLSHNQLIETIGLIGKEVSPLINKGL